MVRSLQTAAKILRPFDGVIQHATDPLPGGIVVAMLSSEGRRTFGWAALTSAFPELATKVPSYDPAAPVSECRIALKPLEEALAEQSGVRS